MIFHSTQSDDYLWYLILRGKKTKTPKYKVPPQFSNSRNKKFRLEVVVEEFYKILHKIDVRLMKRG